MGEQRKLERQGKTQRSPTEVAERKVWRDPETEPGQDIGTEEAGTERDAELKRAMDGWQDRADRRWTLEHEHQTAFQRQREAEPSGHCTEMPFPCQLALCWVSAHGHLCPHTPSSQYPLR